MTDTTPDTSPADAFDLPASWTDEARDLFGSVLDVRPDLDGPEAGSLWHACALTSAAERLDEVARAAGYVSTGSTGQLVVHPAVSEARHARTAAASILRNLVPLADAEAPMTASERGRRAARKRWDRERGRTR